MVDVHIAYIHELTMIFNVHCAFNHVCVCTNTTIYQHVGVSLCNCDEPPNSDFGRVLINEFHHLTIEMDSLQQGTHRIHRTR